MDGNGRWAKKRGLSRSEGHKAGTEAAKAIVTECRNLSIPHLTLYTFSRENWNRPKEEVFFLFDLLVSFLRRELPDLIKQSIRLKVLGEWEDLPFGARQMLRLAVSRTKNCTGMTLNLALNYSSRFEILRACKELLRRGIDPAELSEEMFSGLLYTRNQPDPDLVIRTSGELRLSNYLLFQTAYSELYFTDVLWPDFSPQELHKALHDFENRSRRFGLTGEQAE